MLKWHQTAYWISFLSEEYLSHENTRTRVHTRSSRPKLLVINIVHPVYSAYSAELYCIIREQTLLVACDGGALKTG